MYGHANLLGKVGIDQTTPGTTNKVSIGTDGTVAVTGTVAVSVATVPLATNAAQEAGGNLDAIAAVEGIDCLFVGRMDLSVSLGAAGPTEARVVEAVNLICAAGRRYGKTVGMFIPPSEDCMTWRERGASLFLLASDQQFLLDGARELARKLGPVG